MKNYIKAELSEEKLNKEVNKAVQSNDLEYVKYLFSSPELKIHANPNANENRCFELACGYGHLEIVDYLINSPDVNFDTPRKNIIHNGIIFAVTHNKIDLLDYFLNKAQKGTNPTEIELKKENMRILERACSFGHTEIVDYIFKNTRVEIDSDSVDKLFEQCIYNGNSDLVRYFILECNVLKSKSIELLLFSITGPERKEMERIFALRETNLALQKDLTKNDINTPK
jgi:hypothetical protein